MHKDKHFCKTCGWAAKGPCPQSGHENVLMHSNWRPGKKNSKFRLWDNRVRGSGVDLAISGGSYSGWYWRVKGLQRPSKYMKDLGAKDSSYV